MPNCHVESLHNFNHGKSFRTTCTPLNVCHRFLFTGPATTADPVTPRRKLFCIFATTPQPKYGWVMGVKYFVVMEYSVVMFCYVSEYFCM